MTAALPLYRPLILCVDDELPALSLRKLVLEKNGFAVLTATNSADALELFLRHPEIALVLADHFLGTESGIELAAQLKHLAPTLPIVLLSGAPPDTMANIDCFIQKGEPISTTLRILNDLLHR